MYNVHDVQFFVSKKMLDRKEETLFSGYFGVKGPMNNRIWILLEASLARQHAAIL